MASVRNLLACFVCLLTSCTILCKDHIGLSDRELSMLVAEISKDASPLHSEITPAVLRLSELGPRVLPRIFPLILDPEPSRRLHAQEVIKRVVSEIYGFTPGQGWSSDESRMVFWDLWKKNGDLQWDSASDARMLAFERWEEWYSRFIPTKRSR